MSLLELVVNPNSGRNILPDCCTPETFADVRAFHRTLPGYQPTPLVALPDLAKEVGVKGVYIKDESKRFGLNAFKALGASYAIHKLFPDGNVGLTVTATDGNHGKGMAWSTHRLGGHAVVFMPAGTVASRVEAIRAIGDTEVTVTDLNYDGTVATAAAYAKEHGGHLVQDTAFAGYEEVPKNITLGYSTMAAEALEELAALGVGEPTHTFLQAGVGSMAGGVAAYLAETCKNPPAMAVVEAWESACVLESIRQGRLVTIEGHTQTSMAGLNCGTPNPQVMPILQEWAQFYIRCQDEVTFRAMRRLAHPGPHETAVISGESGASGLGAFLAVMDNPEYRKTMGFDETSVILLFSTEGDTDPDHYKAVVADWLPSANRAAPYIPASLPKLARATCVPAAA